MRYAIISDVHGNLTALNAVLEDCKNQNIDKYLLLGDYFGAIPMPNEVISRIREINDIYAIQGNGEERLIELNNTNPCEWTSEQFAPLYWTSNNVNEDNYKYIESLSVKLSFTADNIKYYMAHSPSQHFGYGVLDSISGRTFLNQFGKDYTNHTEYLEYIRKALIKDKKFMEKLAEMSEGVYLFGHYHTQWHTTIDDKLLINPGSCGWTLDFDTSAPYTILDTNNGFSIIERRIQYDMTIPVKILRESDYFNVAPFWNNLSIMEYENAKSAIMPFLEFVEEFAMKRNDKTRPYSNELWREAIILYNEKM